MDITKKLITDVDYRGLQAAYNDMTCAPSGVKNCHKLMRLFFKLMEQEDICKDITKSLVVPKPKKKNAPGEIIVFNDEELEAIKKIYSQGRSPLLWKPKGLQIEISDHTCDKHRSKNKWAAGSYIW